METSLEQFVRQIRHMETPLTVELTKADWMLVMHALYECIDKLSLATLDPERRRLFVSLVSIKDQIAAEIIRMPNGPAQKTAADWIG